MNRQDAKTERFHREGAETRSDAAQQAMLTFR